MKNLTVCIIKKHNLNTSLDNKANGDQCVGRRNSISRTYTSSVSCQPVVVYENADMDKVKLLADNRNKSGVYQWVNLKNGKSYVGSSTDLGRRFKGYYSIYFLEKETQKRKSLIYSALLKYGYANFSVKILEHCDPSEVISREQYYLDLLKPEYNILKFAYSLLGFKHSEETKTKLIYLTPEQNAKRLELLENLHANPEYQAKRLENLKIYLSSAEHKEHLKRLHSSEEHKEHGCARHESCSCLALPCLALKPSKFKSDGSSPTRRSR